MDNCLVLATPSYLLQCCEVAGEHKITMQDVSQQSPKDSVDSYPSTFIRCKLLICFPKTVIYDNNG